MAFKKVTMNLNERSFKNIDDLSKHLDEKEEAKIVGAALNIANDMFNLIQRSSKIIVIDKEGNKSELSIKKECD